MSYSIDKIYVDNNNKIIILDKNQYYYENGISLKCFVLNNNLDMFLYNLDATNKQNLNIDECNEIIKMAEINKKMPLQQRKKLKITSFKLANIISYLIGFNVLTNPKTNIKQEDVSNVVMSARKISHFKKILANYIYITLIKEKELIINNEDYRVILALKKSHIKLNIINEFVIKVTPSGDIKINKPQNFQKTINKKSLTNI